MKKNLVLSFFIIVAACSPKPYASTNKVHKQQVKQYVQAIQQPTNLLYTDSMQKAPYFVGTTNFSIRKPNFVIIHHTAQNSCNQTLRTFTLPRTAVSAHYVICREGIVYQMLNDYFRAQHAGVGKWGNITDMNSCSIGIELDNNGFEPFTQAQINALISLLEQLKNKYNIPTANFIGHADWAPTRKNDPSILFPWKQLAAKGLGLWYDDNLEEVPAHFNHLQALKVIGYDIKDTTAAIVSFKRHFMQDSIKQLNIQDKKVLYNLSKKF